MESGNAVGLIEDGSSCEQCIQLASSPSLLTIAQKFTSRKKVAHGTSGFSN